MHVCVCVCACIPACVAGQLEKPKQQADQKPSTRSPVGPGRDRRPLHHAPKPDEQIGAAGDLTVGGGISRFVNRLHNCTHNQAHHTCPPARTCTASRSVMPSPIMMIVLYGWDWRMRAIDWGFPWRLVFGWFTVGFRLVGVSCSWCRLVGWLVEK
jgi:hypothetical protein